jgi:hypothetical protein
MAAATAISGHRRLPHFEHSYETILASHRKVSTAYDICVAIPRSKKFLLWLTHSEGGCEDVAHLYEYKTPTPPPKRDDADFIHRDTLPFRSTCPTTPYGTLLYGSMFRPPAHLSATSSSYFVVEDVLLWGGNPTHTLPFGMKLGVIRDVLVHTTLDNTRTDLPSAGRGRVGGSSLWLVLPVMYGMDRAGAPPLTSIPYTVHHVQYRSLKTCEPHLKVFLDPKPVSHDLRFSQVAPPATRPAEPVSKLDTGRPRSAEQPGSAPQVSYDGMVRRAVFRVRPSTQTDVYHLHADDARASLVGAAHIPDYKTSVWMNALFRNIKENRNLDAIEESDDEEEFEDVRPDKYVDLKRERRIECVYHRRFRKWVPMKPV